MLRWIVAGVLLALLIALIVVDELGGTAKVPGASGSAQGAIASGKILEGELPLEPGVPPPLPDDWDVSDEVKPGVDEACDDVKSAITAARDESFMEEIGHRMFAVFGIPEVIALCHELDGLEGEQAIARIEAAIAAQPAPEGGGAGAAEAPASDDP